MPASIFPDLFAIDAFARLSIHPALWMPLAALAAVLLDRILGEAKCWHPLVGFGKLAHALEHALNRGAARRWRGLAAWAFIVLPWVGLLLLIFWHKPYSGLGWAVDVLLLYFALGGRSLAEHAERVAADLAAGDLAAARVHVGWMVSRDTAALDEAGVASACVETTLENGNDAIFAALFWFALLGGAGALLYRLANTLDAMWGYKNERFFYFGWAAARIDDVLNFIPARLTALAYALCGQTRRALRCWRQQATQWESPNAGPVMSAGAGALGLALGGAAIYHGKTELRPQLGEGRAALAGDIPRAIQLLRRSLALYLSLYVLASVLWVLCVITGGWALA